MTAGPPALAEHPDVRSGLDLLSAWSEAQLASAGVPGLSIGIVHDQALVWARGFGWASLERRTPATPETLYRVASGSTTRSPRTCPGSRSPRARPTALRSRSVTSCLHPLGGQMFRLETRDGFGTHGEPVVLELDGAGRVARLKIGENYTHPVTEW